MVRSFLALAETSLEQPPGQALAETIE